MGSDSSSGLGNRNFLWLWFAAVNIAFLLGTLWLGVWGLIAPVIGIGGAFVALLFAKSLAIKAHDISVVNPANPRNEVERQLHDMVADVANRAGLTHVPAVGIYDSPELNSFATGANEKGALIAFTQRLISEVPPAELQAIAAHEVAHIVNRDMLAMVLLQGAITSVVVFFLAPLVLFQLVLKVFGRGEEGMWVWQGLLWIAKVAIGAALAAVGFVMVRMFSRRRELRADTLAARLCGSESVIAALKTLDRDTAIAPKSQLSYATFKIVGRSSFGELFSTHPTYARRVANLENFAPPLEVASIAQVGSA